MFFSLKKQLGDFEFFYTVYYCICRLCDKLMLKCFTVIDLSKTTWVRVDVSLMSVFALSSLCFLRQFIMISTLFQLQYKGNELLSSPS